MTTKDPSIKSSAPFRVLSLVLLTIAAVFSTVQYFRLQAVAEMAHQAAAQALKGQSRYLALSAEEALEDWQADKALLLALNALPGPYGGDRPMVPAAHLALNRAVHQVANAHQITLEHEPRFAVISPDTAYLAVVPADADAIEVFEVASRQRVLHARHEDEISYAAFSPDGRILATLGGDGLRVWDMSTQSALGHYDSRTLKTSSQAASDKSLSSLFESLSLQPVDLPQIGGAISRDQLLPLVAFSADGERLAFASDSGLEIRQVADGQLLHLVDVDPKFLYFAEDGSRVMVLNSANDEFIAVDASSGEIQKLADDVIVSMALNSPQGTKLAGVENGHLVLFDAGGERYAEMKTQGVRRADSTGSTEPRGSLSAATSVALGPDLVAGGTNSGVIVWDMEKQTQLEHFRGGRVASIAVSPDGEYLVAGTWDGKVRLWETDAFGSRRLEVEAIELPTHRDRVVYVGFAGNGEYVISLAADRSLTFRKLTTRKMELDEWLPDRNAAVLSRDGQTLAKYDDRIRTLTVWDMQTGAKRATINRPAQPLGRNSFHPDGDHLVVSTRFPTVLGEVQPGAEILDLTTGQPAASTDGRKAVVDRSIYTMAGERIVTAAIGEQPSFSIWDADDGLLLRHVDGEQLLAGSWGGSHLLALAEKQLMLHDLSDNTSSALSKVRQYDDSGEAPMADFDHDGTRLLISQGTALELWDLRTRQIIDSFSAAAPPTHLGINGDGSSWFAVINGALMVREDGATVARIEVDVENLLFALVDGNIVTVTLRGTVNELSLPQNISVEEAIAQLPTERSCLTPDEREAYDLPPLTNTQWRERGCEHFASEEPPS